MGDVAEKTGLFVVFEGGEGSGKSTQSRELKRRLIKEGCPAVLVHEPGGTPTGERVRRWLKSGHNISHMAETLLFSAARAELVTSVIHPALSAGQVVISDRYIYSTLAYQGSGRGLDLDTVHRLNQLSTGGLLPQLVVFLDLAPEAGLARKSGTPLDRFELEDGRFHDRVRRGYIELAQADPERWLVLDSSQNRQTLAESVWQRVSGMLKE